MIEHILDFLCILQRDIRIQKYSEVYDLEEENYFYWL